MAHGHNYGSALEIVLEYSTIKGQNARWNYISGFSEKILV